MTYMANVVARFAGLEVDVAGDFLQVSVDVAGN